MLDIVVGASLPCIGTGNTAIIEVFCDAFDAPTLCFKFNHLYPDVDLEEIYRHDTNVAAGLLNLFAGRQVLQNLAACVDENATMTIWSIPASPETLSGQDNLETEHCALRAS